MTTKQPVSSVSVPISMDVFHATLEHAQPAEPLLEVLRRLRRVPDPRQVVKNMDDVLLSDWLQWTT